jgi:hypothetical protein
MTRMLVWARPRRGVAVVATAVALAVPSCAQGYEFRFVDLKELVARQDEAPLNLVYAPRLSGATDLEAFRDDLEGRLALRRAGFRAAFVALLATPTLVDFLVLSEAGDEPPRHQALLSSTAALFGSEDGAAAALTFFRQDAAAGVLSEQPLPAREFGDGAFAFRGVDERGEQVIVYGWRVGNLYQSTKSEGPVHPSDVLFVARNMHRRAEGLS